MWRVHLGNHLVSVYSIHSTKVESVVFSLFGRLFLFTFEHNNPLRCYQFIIISWCSHTICFFFGITLDCNPKIILCNDVVLYHVLVHSLYALSDWRLFSCVISWLLLTATNLHNVCTYVCPFFEFPINFKLIKERCVWVIEGSRPTGLAFSFRLAPSNRKSHSNFKHVWCILGKPKNQENKFLEGLVVAFGMHWHFAKLCLYARISALLSIRNISMGWESSNNAQSGNGMLCFGRRKSQKGVVMRLYSNFYPLFLQRNVAKEHQYSSYPHLLCSQRCLVSADVKTSFMFDDFTKEVHTTF